MLQRNDVRQTSKNFLAVKYYSFRNITGPEDKSHNRTIYSGQLPITSIVEIPTDENIQEYLAEEKKQHPLTPIHRAIKDTLNDWPEMFSVLNGGIVIVARDLEVDEKNMALRLLNPSIINGFKTQEVIKEFLAESLESPPIHVKFELILTNDTELITEISIARNFQSMPILGCRQAFDELEKALQEGAPKKKLQKSETQYSNANDYYAIDKLIRVIAALLPESLWWKSEPMNKLYIYNRKVTCLNDFQEIWKGATDKVHPLHAKLKEVYNFYLSIAGTAFNLYKKWKVHQGFKEAGLYTKKKDDAIDVPDGIIFPIFAGLSVFAVKEKNQWSLKVPEELDQELIQSATSAYKEIADSKPHLMGTTKACYLQLEQLTRIYKNLAQRYKFDCN